MLTIERLNQFYAGSHILRDVSLGLEAGAVNALMGRNGVGKTTLLKCLLGLLPVESGRILFDGEDISGLETEARVARGIGYVPQGRMIFPTLTVAENLEVATAGSGRRDVPASIFELFPVLGDMLDRRGGDLSGGQQQQLAIGRALVREPRLLILDEPCEGIQPSVVQAIASTIRQLNETRGMTVLVVEQRLRFVGDVADRFFVMERGEIRADGEIDALDDGIVGRYLAV